MNPGILVGAGFLLGSVGVKALTSKKAKQVYVKGIVQGMRAKEEVETMVDEARAEFDDLLAEAGYAKETEDSEDGASDQEEGGASSKDSEADSMEVAKQLKKVANTVAKGAGKGAGSGGRCHGRGHGGRQDS